MKIKCRLPFFIRHVAVAILAASAMPVQAAPLNKVLEQVFQQHPDVLSSQALLSASRESIIQARSGFFPVLGLSGQASEGEDEQSGTPLDRNVRRIDASLRWNVFRGLSDKHGMQAAKHDSLAAEADLNEAHERVALEVTLVYIEVLRLRCLVDLGQSFVADQMRLSDEINHRVQAGRIPVADASQAKAGLIQAERLLAQSQSQLTAVEHRFRMLTGQAPEAMSLPSFKLLEAGQSMDSLLEKLAQGNPRLKAARERVAARGEEIGVAGGALYPSIDLEFRKRLNSEIDPPTLTDTVENQAIQLNYQLPLGGASYSRIRQAEFRKTAAQAETDSILLRLQAELGQAWALWKETVELKQKYLERAQAANTVVAAYDLQFDAGRRSLLDLIAVRLDRFQALADLTDNRVQELAANARMLSAFGELKRSILAQENPAQAGEAGSLACPPGLVSLLDKRRPDCSLPGCGAVPAMPMQNAEKALATRVTLLSEKSLSMPMSGECKPPFTQSCLAGTQPSKQTSSVKAKSGRVKTMQLSKQPFSR